MAEVETLHAKIQRVSDAFDKRFGADIWKPRLRDRKAGQPMADPERQDKLDRLEEVTIVQAAILGRLERKYDEAIRRHDEAIKHHDEEIADLRDALLRLHSAVDKTVAAVEKTNADVQIMNSAMNGLFQRMDRLNERIDRFIQGQEGNGRKQ